MIPETAVDAAVRSNGLHPEDTERLTRYADHLQHSPLPGHRALEPQARRRYLRAVGAWPSVRDCAIALLPLYVGTPHRRDPRPGRR